jgi:hypothetical protein
VLARSLCTLLVVVTGLVAGCGEVHDQGEPGVSGTGSGVTRQISGNWTGTLHQKGVPPFQVAVDIGADSTAQVAYSGIKCGGDWTIDRVQTSIPPRYIFTERIKAGAGGSCKGTGSVALLPVQAHSPNEPAYSRMHYSFTGGGVSSRGLLHRTDPAHMDEVFKEAGVGAP